MPRFILTNDEMDVLAEQTGRMFDIGATEFQYIGTRGPWAVFECDDIAVQVPVADFLEHLTTGFELNAR